MSESVICQFKLPRWIKSLDVESRGSDCCFDNSCDARVFVRCRENRIEDKMKQVELIWHGNVLSLQEFSGKLTLH
jgi:hypothetical protein